MKHLAFNYIEIPVFIFKTHLMKKLYLALLATVFTFCAVLVPGSLNAQITWERTNNPAGGYIFEVFAGPDGLTFTMAEDMLYRSLNSGDNWESIEGVGDYQRIVGIDDNGNVYVQDSTTLYRSSDNGDTWLPVLSEESTLYLLEAPGDTLYTYWGKILMSTDNGLNWITIDSTVYNLAINSAGHLIKSSGNQILISTDQAASWTVIAEIESFDIQAIAVNTDDEIFVGCYTTGIYRISPDGTIVEQLSENF